MKKNSALAGFVERFQSILDGLDEFGTDEEMEELNAELEDALFWMESIDIDDEDAEEEIDDALTEIEGLLAEYDAPAREDEALRQKLMELDMVLKMARSNLL